MIMHGRYFGGLIDRDIVPLSDGAGEVEAIGEGVTRFAPGDRVAGSFFQNWFDGPPNPDVGVALGAPPAKGMLAQYVTLPETGVVRIAESLSFEQAATLPCAGVTAWNALMEGPRPVAPGRSVLLIGTGGVSMLALSLAKAAGATVVVTSSSHEKLERAKALGADHLVNYREDPEWGLTAARLCGGGVDHVVEVGGTGTLMQSMLAVGYAGEVALIGVLAQGGETGPHPLMLKGASLRGIFVGSRGMATRLNAAVDACGIKPVIDRLFDFEDAVQAYRHQSSPDLFGKTVIRV
jgi:NADPH:quinone reductase-like Zn-dependent oxidoreductase